MFRSQGTTNSNNRRGNNDPKTRIAMLKIKVAELKTSGNGPIINRENFAQCSLLDLM